MKLKLVIRFDGFSFWHQVYSCPDCRPREMRRSTMTDMWGDYSMTAVAGRRESRFSGRWCDTRDLRPVWNAAFMRTFLWYTDRKFWSKGLLIKGTYMSPSGSQDDHFQLRFPLLEDPCRNDHTTSLSSPAPFVPLASTGLRCLSPPLLPTIPFILNQKTMIDVGGLSFSPLLEIWVLIAHLTLPASDVTGYVHDSKGKPLRYRL